MFWSLTTYLTNNLSSFVLMICLFRYLVLNKRDKRLPKGPMGIPLFGYLPFLGSNPFVTLWKLQKQFGPIYTNEVKIHSRSIENELSIRDLIDYYILEVHLKQDAAILMSIDKLRANCHVFLSFGNEAFLSSLEWSLILIARFSNHQQSIYDEIMKVIGVKRIPAFKDEHRMPFTVAFINEVLRWRTVLPLNLIRRAIDDTSIMGHFIPKDTLVLANIWAVHHDSKIWDNPSKFNPYRFLTEDGKTLIDHEGFIPFSLGKRSCVAESFVRKWLFIFVVTIVQNFHIKSPNHREEIFDEKFSLTLRPKQNTNLIFHAREERFKEK
ncbi:Cytochrome P450 2U1 [Sarcoptes scabiei]|nr:Cytochrome P450 2U1 [Sarcoptes scabiei]